LKHSFYYYIGSISHPPCSSVKRVVMIEPIEVSRESIENVKKLMTNGLGY